jgi:hypothetical protein
VAHEPHSHPITAKLGYVHKGHARMRVLAPDGTLDEYKLFPFTPMDPLMVSRDNPRGPVT